MSGQRGPVEPGRPAGEELPLDADLAVQILESALGSVDPDLDAAERALDALTLVVGAARRYVKGRTVGRFLELARALQETPDVDRPHEITEAQVERYLAAHDQLRITRDAARRLGLIT